MHKHNNSDNRKIDPQVELEAQFIMRLPPEPSALLKETLRNCLPLKDRLSIRFENDLRYGEVRFDNWLLHAKLVDLPTIVESMKTIDNKSFYKTADISQLLLCSEESHETTPDEESPIQKKKKDPNKVDKKFLWPHGITPPTKNVRRKRFRKTLRKKYVEAPEIEKEVRRLLRNDNDAVNVKWEVICDEEDQTKPTIVTSSGTVEAKRENLNDGSQSVDVAEDDIFGALSESDNDDEEAHINVMELDENSRLSVDSRISDSNSMQVKYLEQSANEPSMSNEPLITEFSKGMFETEETIEDMKPDLVEMKIPKTENYEEYEMSENFTELQAAIFDKDSIQTRREQLKNELAKLQDTRRSQEVAILNIENEKLRERFQETIDNLLMQEAQKIQEINELNDFSTEEVIS